MLKIAIAGANGRMGKVLMEAVQLEGQCELSAALVREGSALVGVPVADVISDKTISIQFSDNLETADFDVLIDFTQPEPTMGHVELCKKLGKAIVIGTTGLSREQMETIEQAGNDIPVCFAANYSVGINLSKKLVRLIAAVYRDEADIEIIETHHRHKVDAPSGTALVLGHEIADELGRDLEACAVYGREGNTGPRARDTIGFETVRAGDVVGDHTVLFAVDGERLELTHKASSRMTFAKGATRAAVWLNNQTPGFYGMDDVLAIG